jgi:urease accessory protein
MSHVTLEATPFLKLLQLVSPALPIGTFAYSHGLEAAVELRLVTDAGGAADFIEGLLRVSLSTWEIPTIVRLHGGFQGSDSISVRRWNDRLFASRASSELAEESRQLGLALARVLTHLGIAEASVWRTDPRVTYEAMFALAAAQWNIPMVPALHAYAFGWCEMLVGAATKLIPLGQSESQRILMRLGRAVGPATERGLSLEDREMAATAPGHAMASAEHELQYTRLFRS